MAEVRGEEQLPWLQRQLEMKKLIETIERLKRTYVYTSEEIIRIVGERYRRLRPRRPGLPGRIEFELRRLEVVYNVTRDRLRNAAEMPHPRDMSEFHRKLVDAFVGLENYEAALARIRRSIKLVKSFWDEYRTLIASAESAREAARLRKEGSGRILSIVRRRGRDLELLRRVRIELLKSHVIAEGLPIVVVAGIPSAGKSTLVGRLSTAEPEVAAYPFTTKKIIVGKVTNTVPNFYLVDTPGILERPRELHNEIERRALAALETLPDVVLFLFDASAESIQDIDDQSRLLRDIAANIVASRNKGVIVAVNKIDIAPRKNVEKAMEAAKTVLRETGAQANTCSGIVLLSAAGGSGIDELLKAIMTCLRRYTPWLFPNASQGRHP